MKRAKKLRKSSAAAVRNKRKVRNNVPPPRALNRYLECIILISRCLEHLCSVRGISYGDVAKIEKLITQALRAPALEDAIADLARELGDSPLSPRRR